MKILIKYMIFYNEYYIKIDKQLNLLNNKPINYNNTDTVYKYWILDDLNAMQLYTDSSSTTKFFNTLTKYYSVNKFNFFKTIFEVSIDKDLMLTKKNARNSI